MDGKRPPQFAQPQVVVMQQPCASQLDYTMRNATVPGIFLIIAGVANLICFIIIGVIFKEWHHSIFTSAFVDYVVLGSLALAAAPRSRYGVIIALHIFCVFTEICTVVQIGMHLSDLSSKGIYFLVVYKYGGVIAIDTIFTLLAIGALVCAIFLQVQASKLTCCRPMNQTYPTTHMAQGQAMPMTTQPVYYIQQAPPPYSYTSTGMSGF